MEYVYTALGCALLGYAAGYVYGYDWVDVVETWMKKHGF